MTAKAKPADPSDALDPKKALVPTVVKVNEARVTRGFWPKIQRTAARIPSAAESVNRPRPRTAIRSSPRQNSHCCPMPGLGL